MWVLEHHPFDVTKPTHFNLRDDCSDPAVAARCRCDFQMSSREEKTEAGAIESADDLVVED